MNLQKRYLEVSHSIRDGVTAFFRFTPEWKNYEFFQMSQNVRLEILRCVVALKVFSKKRNFSSEKLNHLALVKTICYDFAAQLAPNGPAIPVAQLAQLV
jgi:hypothetical protein